MVFITYWTFDIKNPITRRRPAVELKCQKSKLLSNEEKIRWSSRLVKFEARQGEKRRRCRGILRVLVPVAQRAHA